MASLYFFSKNILIVPVVKPELKFCAAPGITGD